MDNKVVFDKELIRRYDTFGPRYTSYPTAVQFTTDFSLEDYLGGAKHSNEDPIPSPLSLYLHIPFCDTICYYCGCSKVITKDKSKAAPSYPRSGRGERGTPASGGWSAASGPRHLPWFSEKPICFYGGGGCLCADLTVRRLPKCHD